MLHMVILYIITQEKQFHLLFNCVFILFDSSKSCLATLYKLQSQPFYGVRCIESNCDYKTVSVLLGHANITTTLNLYVRPNMEQKKKCITKMFKSLGK